MKDGTSPEMLKLMLREGYLQTGSGHYSKIPEKSVETMVESVDKASKQQPADQPPSFDEGHDLG